MSIRPAFLGTRYPHLHGIADEILPELMYHLRLPDIGYPAKAIQLKTFIKVNRFRVHHLTMPQIKPPTFVRLDRADTSTAVISIDTMSGLSATAGTDKVHRPAIQIHAIDEIAFSLRRLAEVFRRGIERIRRRTVSTTTVYIMLAPDHGVRHMDVLFLRQISQIIGR